MGSRGNDRSGEASVDIEAWLRDLGLEQYAQSFRENAIDAAVLPELTADDLKDLGVNLVGHRRRLLGAIAALRGNGGPAPSAPATQVAPVSAAERRQLTVLFCDLVGSTALSSHLDPEDMREVIAAYHRVVTEIVTRFDGFVAKYMGDGVLAYFGYPRAHEDDAERAVRAGLSVVDAIVRLDIRCVELQARVGIATGLVVVGDLIGEGSAQEQSVVGETPNLAARLQALAEPSAVIIASSTRRLLGDLFEYHGLGTIELKGIAAPVAAWQVLRQSAVASRFEALRGSALTHLVGREEEVDLLLRRWARTKATHGQVVLISGEAGIGKSRLTAALEERLYTEPHLRLRYFCSPYHQDSALYPFIDQLGRASGFGRDDPAATRLEKLAALLARAAPPDEDLALLADLLSLPPLERQPLLDLDPHQKKERTLNALIRQLEGLARQQPVLMVFEDAHWIDPTSRELLDLTVERVCNLPVLLIITFRSEFQPPWIGQPQVTMLALNRLGGQEAASLVQSVAGGKRLPGEILDQIVERTDGIPLFIEELTKTVLEGGLLRENDGSFVVAGPILPLNIPSSLQASLMARLDRLAPVREVAQIGAAIGRQFSFELLAAVARRNHAQLTDALDQLVAAGLVFRRGSPPHASFIFKHSLVQDAAYRTLLRSRRQQLHGDIAEALAGRFPNVAQAQPELMAHHYTQAGQLANAIESWLRAGQLAIARSAYIEATANLRKGLELTRSSTGQESQEINLQLALGAALIAIKGYASAEAELAFMRARELLEGTADTARIEQALHGLQMITYNRAEFQKSLDFSQQQMQLVEQRGDPLSFCAAHKNMASTLHSMGRFEPAFWHAQRAMSLLETEFRETAKGRYAHDLGIAAMGYYAMLAWHRGLFRASADTAQTALSAAEQSGHTNTRAYARHHVGALRAAVLADMSMLETQADALLTLAQENRLPQWIAWATCYCGPVLVYRGMAAEAVHKVREGIQQCEQLGNKAFRPLFLGFLAAAQAAIGNCEEAILTLEEAIAIGEETAERWYAAELWRNKGDLNRNMDSRKGMAEECFQRASAIAVEQGSRCFELRAATRVARLWHDQGEASRARGSLAPIYGSFTEGFDTPDLREAKELLEALSN
jgi:predicted ATPase/class 3 adenylate cyclase